jgi:high-affinity nickel-transport protein
VFLGAAGVAWLFGLRHALDADHIAAIDNVTRKLAQTRRRFATVGLFFSLGHASLVVLACLAVGELAAHASAKFAELQRWGGLIGGGVSAFILMAVALANVGALARTLETLRAQQGDGGRSISAEHAAEGPLSRIMGPLFGAISRPWQMYPLGFLFGLGFDTATEVGLLALAAQHASGAAALPALLAFPALFTAGMCLIDTSDSVVMAHAYGWALERPKRRLVYNAVVTSVSILAAASIALVEVVGLVAASLAVDSGPWGGLAWGNRHFSVLGIAIVAILLAIWLGAWLVEGAARPWNTKAETDRTGTG